MKTHTLRVCSPGDYKPFSFMETDGHFEGLDVDMMNSLAGTLDAKVKFVKTTWAQLMDDFTSGKCDIGAGGISVSLRSEEPTSELQSLMRISSAASCMQKTT